MKQHNKPCQGKVYMFHDISDKNDTYSISVEHFREFVDHMVLKHRVVTVDELVNNPDSNNIVLTFDDAYSSVYEHAYPILKKYNVPYYVFICTEYLDQDKYLNEKMLKQMLSDSSCIIGSHNMKHDMARFMDQKQLDDDLLKSKQLLGTLAGQSLDSFAFPYGSMYACCDENIDMAKKYYDYVFMTYGVSYNNEYENVIPRININDKNYLQEMK